MYISDYTKGNPERLGCSGAARPGQLHTKVNQVDLHAGGQGRRSGRAQLLSGGHVNADIRMSMIYWGGAG